MDNDTRELILSEKMNGKLDTILEYVEDIPQIKADVGILKDDMRQVQTDVAAINQVVRQHSKDIAELKAARV